MVNLSAVSDIPYSLTSIFGGIANGTDADESEDKNDAALMAFRIIVCILGVVGNLMVIFVIVVLREHKKAITNWYVLQLAVADTLFLLTLPFKVVEESRGEWIFSGGMCKAKEALLFLNYYSSILFLMVMSIDRYIALCHAFSGISQKLRTKSSAYIITAVVWIVALCLCTPVIIYSDKSGIEPFCKCRYEFPKQVATPEEECAKKGMSEGDALQSCLSAPKLTERCKDLNDFDFSQLFGAGNSSLENAFDANMSSTEYSGDMKYDQYEVQYDQYEDNSANESMASSETIYEMGCSYALNSAGWSAYLMFNFIAMFVIPFIVMSVCYLLIALRLRQTQKRRSSITEGSSVTTSGKGERKRSKSAASAKAERNRIRVTFVCLILVVLFLICWLPFHSVHLAKMKGVPGSQDFCARLSAVASLIAYLNSALNPYVYNFIGTKFGNRLRSAAGSVRASVKRRTTSMSSSAGTVRYQHRKHSVGTSSNSATVFTKINRGKSEGENSHTPSNIEEDTHGNESSNHK